MGKINIFNKKNFYGDVQVFSFSKRLLSIFLFQYIDNLNDNRISKPVLGLL